MAIDLDRFIGTFFDEAQEHLENLEEMAMSLGTEREDRELLDSIFRAAHSIKGGSGTFGFAQLSEATHEMEAIFDSLRKSEGRADPAMVRLLLDALDAFKAHLVRLKAGERGDDPAMESVRRRLRQHRGRKARKRARAGQAAARRLVARSAYPGDAPAVRNALRQTLGRVGELLECPEGDDAVRVSTQRSLDEVCEILAFALAPGTFRVEEEAQEAPQRPAAGEEKFGFFDAPAQTPAAEANFGLFESPAAATAQGARPRADQSSIRVSVDKIDRIVNLVGELVISHAMLLQAAGKRSAGEDDHLDHSLATLDRNTRELQQAVMSIRMMPMEFVFSRFPRLVYDVSTRLGKKVDLETRGHETELDKELIELLVDPLTHVVRNAIDHGIEAPAERIRAGKPDSGTVSMRATHRGGSVIIEVSDDGRGLDRERILATARRLGIAVDEDAPDADVWDLVFRAGFSTVAEVTDVSGRGVGMDVVRRNIASLGGSVAVASERGAGTTIIIQLPLTLAVFEGMIVCVADERYIVPIEFVAEAFKPGAGDIRAVGNQDLLVAVRGEHLPIVRLEDFVALPERGAAGPEPLCLVVEIDGRRAALLVDSLVGQQQLVVKSIDVNLHRVGGIAGATILGDGRVALILDAGAIVRAGAGRRARVAA
jgi:two-component system chemotaxis sensor kinase CheA